MAKHAHLYLPEQLVLKITLIGSDPKIWRRVEVHSGLTLDDLHVVTQCVFDWDGGHLYQFYVPPGGKLTRRAMDQATRYSVTPADPFFGGDDFGDERADKAEIGQVLTPDQKQIVYEYDFGDSWEHLVKVEKRIPGGDQSHIPVCLAGENAAPLDDMGGIYGYYEWLDALRDKSSPDHEQALEWLGDDFDPARFDLDQANRQLRKVFKPAVKKPPKPRKKKT